MKLLKYIVALPLAFSFIGIAQAKGDIFYTAPFSNIEVKAASKIYVDYGFDSHQQTLICKTLPNDGVMTSAEWSYKDATRKIELPVTLKDDARFEGHYADPEGKLTITNEFGPDSIFVTCEYRKMN